MKKVLLFDFDGTIADSFESFLDIADRLSVKYNIQSISRKDIEKLRLEDARSLIKKLNVPFYKIPFLASDMKKMQQEHILQIKPFKDLPKVLQEIKSMGYTLGILTSNGRENVELFVKKNNINVFDYIYSNANIFGKDKAIRKFLKEKGLTTNQVMYVGDEIRDILACQNVGVKIISVTWGFNSKEGLIKYHPDFLVDHPNELVKLLRNQTQ